ncbi:MAG: hypothetical protein KDA75_11110, partial [Planctomycetaceae bacterium]|nr:hypothetical protein [Planctomycetaceae bacterium]
MSRLARGWLLCGLSLLLGLYAGCSRSSSSNSSTSDSEDAKHVWKPFPLPDYTRLNLEEVSAPLREEIEVHQAEIDALFDQRESLPLGQRYSISAEEDVYTAKDFDAEYYQFRLAQDLETYRRCTTDRDAAAETAAQFLTEYDRMACSMPEAKSRDEIKAI